MVRKLYKYELSHFAKMMFPFLLIMPIAALLIRIIHFFQPEVSTDFDTVYAIISGSFSLMFGISVMLCFIMLFITTVLRFYKNLFTAEGYLTMTLPVTESQHIFVKLSTAVLFTVIATVTVFASFCIITSGVELVEITKAVAYLCKMGTEEFGVNFFIFIAEYLLAALLGTACSYLTFYACITLGQLAKKARIFLAFAIYFAYYLVSQFIGTVFMVFMALNYELYEKVAEYIADTFTATQIIHAGGLIAVASNAIFAIILFIISKAIMKHKLNLE